jgi:hypothetical protein
MLAYADMLIPAAKEAGMKVPYDPDSYDKEEYPHFFVYAAIQLGQALPYPSAHWDNAHVIAAIPVEKLKLMTMQDFYDAGFEAGFPIP